MMFCINWSKKTEENSKNKKILARCVVRIWSFDWIKSLGRREGQPTHKQNGRPRLRNSAIALELPSAIFAHTHIKEVLDVQLNKSWNISCDKKYRDFCSVCLGIKEQPSFFLFSEYWDYDLLSLCLRLDSLSTFLCCGCCFCQVSRRHPSLVFPSLQL